MYLYQKDKKYFAQVSEGIEELGAEELSELGAKDIETIHRGIYFTAEKDVLYRINYNTRIISRVLAPLISFQCHNTDKLYERTKKLSWEQFLTKDNSFAIFSSVSESKITHSKYASLKLKDAIVDYFREKYNKRPAVNTRNPDVWFHLHIRNNKAVISTDTSGGSLHRRGYRKEGLEAPMQETLGASIIRLSGWNGEQPLYDPMCGSGTLLAEALMSYCRIPSQYLRRHFGFQQLPDYDDKLWKKVKRASDKKIRDLPQGLISGSDISKKAITVTKNNLKAIPHSDKIELKVMDYEKIYSLKDTVIVINPPYGIRIQTKGSTEDFYKRLGDFFKQNCKNSTAYIYFGERKYIKNIGLRTSFKKPLRNGGIDGRLVKLELY
jgi:putative N6-adenine-specific DNA methylase